MDFLNKWVERRRPLRLTQALGARLLLGIEDLVEAVALAQLRHVINDAQVALNHVVVSVAHQTDIEAATVVVTLILAPLRLIRYTCGTL